jgi:L-iditol 2-dehydrogenase
LSEDYSSDIHLWKYEQLGSALIVEGDYVLRHEAAGIVVQIGEGVTNITPGEILHDEAYWVSDIDYSGLLGDRVAIEPGDPCGQCFLCLEGQYNLCREVEFAGGYPHAGTIQRYKAHKAVWLHKYVQNTFTTWLTKRS